MKKTLLSVTIVSSLLLGSFSPAAFAEGPEDVPSQSYHDELIPSTSSNGEVGTMSLGKEYARSFTCDSGDAKTSTPWTEAGGYDWIVSSNSKGYVQDGERGGTTLGVVLNDTVIDFSNPYLVKLSYSGNKSSYVKGIQSVLNCLDYNPGTIDGIYGPNTKDAVKAFQKRRGLTVDGIVGKKTYHYLSFAAY